MKAIVKLKPGTQPELKIIMKDFPKPRPDQQLFIEKFRMVLNTYNLGLPSILTFTHVGWNFRC